MRVVVTGGAGFIGEHLCRRLIADGHAVTCVDNYSTGQRSKTNTLKAEGVRIVDADVREWFATDWDVLYNLACPASPVHYMRDPIGTIETCVHGTMRLLAMAATNGKRILHASTSEVYGEALQHPQSEAYYGNVNPIGPRSSYDEGKRCAEAACFAYRQTLNADVRIARIFNTYGPGMSANDGRIVPAAVMAALTGGALQVHGGDQTRSFCYVDDTVDGLVQLMECEDRTLGPVNIGNPHEVTLHELIETIEAASGKSIWRKVGPYRENDPMRRWPDISLAAQELDWRPVISLSDGIQRTVEWFRHAQT